MRHFSFIDKALLELDKAMQTRAGAKKMSTRPTPQPKDADYANETINSEQKLLTARLMRVNHAGEVAAQALYQGQAFTARLETVRDQMQHAADEEIDHLAWCEERLEELGSQPSILNPVWYAGSFAIGALAGLAGDRWSLGFIEETESQVVNHLEEHLQQIPVNDQRTRSIIKQMQVDEAQHGDTAKQAGAARLPASVKALMQLTSKLMTKTSYWI